MKKLSIVTPVYNEEENIEPLYTQLIKIAEELHRYAFEFIFTDNHSTDKSFEIITSLAQKDPRVKAARLSRNFGYQRSIYTGLRFASGDAAIQVDCDLQDPPSMIIEFVDKWEQGYEVVYGIRQNRQEGFFITIIRKLFYRLLDRLSGDSLPLDAGDFRLVDRKVLNELNKMYDYSPYIRGTIAALGFNQIGIPYNRLARVRGESKFDVGSLFSLAVDAILNHSIIPLRLASVAGIITTGITFAMMIIYMLGRVFFGQSWPAGFATTTALILASISLNGLFLGIIGEYLGRIYHQVKQRPVTVVEKMINFSQPLEPARFSQTGAKE